MIIPDKPRKTAAELKLLIEEKLLTGHPDCERAEVVINLPPLDTLGQPPSSASDRPSSSVVASSKGSLNSFATSSIC